MALAIHYRKSNGLSPTITTVPKPTQQTNKILIMLLFWAGDREQAFRLARLLADLEPQHSELADFLFVARFDAKHDSDTVKYVSRKFNVHTHISRRQETGWPRGCNGSFFGGMEFVYHKMAARQIPRYKAIFNMGADSVPLDKNWLSNFCQTWDSLNRREKVYVAGALVDPNGEHPHINGDATFLSGDLEFLKWLVIRASHGNANAGWDWYLSHQFAEWGWSDIPAIISLWNTKTFETHRWDELTRAGIKMIHGVKDFSLLDLARKKLL